MEIASFSQEEKGRPAPRIPSDASISSNRSSKAHPSFEASYHLRDKRVKLMCSYGGRIMPRPSDRKLRYVGGETRVISVSRHIEFVAFRQKLIDIYGPDLALKYQLPEEDLDALVSISSDEDLENMMDECDRMEASEGPTRLRVFVFSSSDMAGFDLSDMLDPNDSELHYVDAVNAVQVEASFKKASNLGFVGSQKSLNGHQTHISPTQGKGRTSRENAQPIADKFRGNVTSPNDVPRSVTSPLPSVSIEQGKAPLEYVSVKGPDRASHYGAAISGEDFFDLESGGSANSSVSSLHDLYNRYNNVSHYWSPILQKQSHIETSPYRSQLQDSLPRGTAEEVLKQADQLPTMKDAQRKKGVRDSGVSNMGMTIMPPGHLLDAYDQFYDSNPIDWARKQDANVLQDAPLSPGARLQKQLQADLDCCKVEGVESSLPSLNGDVRKPSQHLHDRQPPGRSPFEFQDFPLPSVGTTLDEDHTISSFLHTQLFEPGEIHQFSEAAANLVLPNEPAPPLMVTQQTDREGIPGSFSEVHKPSMDLPAGFSQRDFAGSLYNEVGREKDEMSMFASQSFSQEPYKAVFQTCTSEICPGSIDDGDEFLRHLTTSTDQTSMRDDHYGITSQASWLSPGLPSFPLSSQVKSSMPDSQSLQSDVQSIPANIDRQPSGTPKTQNYDTRLYSPGLMLFGEPLQRGSNDTVSVTKSLEENFTQDRVPKVLTSSQSTPNMMTSDLANSLESLQDLNGLGISRTSLGLSEPPIDANARETPPDLQEGCKTSNEPALSQESEVYSSSIDGEVGGNAEGSRDEEMSSRLGLPSTFALARSVLESWSTSSQSEYELQSVLKQSLNQSNNVIEMEMSGPVENETTVQGLKSEIDDIETFQSAADSPVNLASVAELEAIAHGLQIIKHCDLEELRELGSGTFGTVYHGKWRGTDVAIKRIKWSCFMGRPSERERLIADFWREACILGQLHHPNVVAFYGVVPDGPGGTLATLTEYMVNGSLKQALLKKDRSLDRRKRLLIAMDAAFGMEYLHGKNVVHFDLKCENLLVNLRDLQRPVCKVGDLGLSKVKQQTLVSGGVRGTLPWMAPELLNGSSSLVSEKVDVFSFGIVLWELLTGEEPYATMHYGAIIGGIVNNTLRPPIPTWCDPAWKSLMETCWSRDPAKRPTFSEIVRSLRAMEATQSGKGQGQAPIMV